MRRQVDWATVLLAQALGQVIISPFALLLSGQELRHGNVVEQVLEMASNGNQATEVNGSSTMTMKFTVVNSSLFHDQF